MNTGFYELLGQIGATFISIIASFFLAYVSILKNRRDGIGDKIIKLKREMSLIINQISDTPIPGVIQSLQSFRPIDNEKLDELRKRRLSLTRFSSGTPWHMRVQSGEIDENDVWDLIRHDLEDFFRSILPFGYFPEISADSETFREWARNFLEFTNHIEWFCHDYDQFGSWYTTFYRNLRGWEINHPNPTLNSYSVYLLTQRILDLIEKIKQDLFLEDRYKSCKAENAIRFYKCIMIDFTVMIISSIVIPLLMLLIPSHSSIEIISWISFICFLISCVHAMFLLAKSAM